MTMPTCLENFLRNLTPGQADEVWLYLDGCSGEEMIEIVELIALSDADLTQRQFDIGNMKPGK